MLRHTFPLLLNAQGQKFGKSESGAVCLSPHRTSIYKFYQFWINVDDSDLEKLYKLFTFMELDEIRAIIEEHNKNPHLRGRSEKTCLGPDLQGTWGRCREKGKRRQRHPLR